MQIISLKKDRLLVDNVFIFSKRHKNINQQGTQNIENEKKCLVMQKFLYSTITVVYHIYIQLSVDSY
jgi:hypothetical protein